MRNFGETIRHIRTNRGIKQNELYTDILSKSYAIQFEKGLHDISFYLLLQILDRFPMEVDEFLYLHRDYQESESSWFYSSIGKFGNHNDLAALKKFKQDYLSKYPNSEHQEERLLQIDFRVEQLTFYYATGEIVGGTVEPQIKEDIQKLLRNIQAWTMEDYRFFCNVMDLVDIFDMPQYFKLLLNSIDQYKDFEDGKPIICTLLINGMTKLIFSNMLEEAVKILPVLNDFTKEINQMFYRNYYFFFKALVSLLKGNQDAIAKANRTIEIFRDLEYEFHAEIADRILKEILSEADIQN
ncbi:hypothetical protein ACFFH2_08850 [Enterococcus devriesei]|uniref:Transcriptional activator, Rgg/GadR/MutR family domain-containing protein n=2 Tax=Enterococcus devriesei TaxID=319970 RepID=A0A1L8SQK9_9ENTE|nr:Rgg/GadR/MutR family transcriptional regulator [Enterococcus devriesei]OJG34122.1 transcriptional activator, Rgg/GadR/MutR family domain-containing protein [Enterococcus devriesei]